jgi:hypothetical protein
MRPHPKPPSDSAPRSPIGDTPDPIELRILAHVLFGTHESIRPGERILFRRYLKRRYRRYTGFIADRLRGKAFVVWVDGVPVADPDAPVLVSRDSQIAVSCQRGNVIDIAAGDFLSDAWLN